MQNISTPMLVVAAALIAADRSVLLQRRPLGTVHGGLWEFPGGKVSAGESPEIALVRELMEELEIVVDPGGLKPLAFASGKTAGEEASRPLVILFYTCTKWVDEPRCVEGAELGWFGPGSIASLAMPPLDYPLAARLREAVERDGF